MYSNTRQKRVEDRVNNNSLTSGLNDKQVEFVKNKIDLVEAWKDIAVTEIIDIRARLNSLETKATQAQTILINLAARITALENQ